jgi:hypothetical protein
MTAQRELLLIAPARELSNYESNDSMQIGKLLTGACREKK